MFDQTRFVYLGLRWEYQSPLQICAGYRLRCAVLFNLIEIQLILFIGDHGVFQRLQNMAVNDVELNIRQHTDGFMLLGITSATLVNTMEPPRTKSVTCPASVASN